MMPSSRETLSSAPGPICAARWALVPARLREAWDGATAEDVEVELYVFVRDGEWVDAHP